MSRRNYAKERKPTVPQTYLSFNLAPAYGQKAEEAKAHVRGAQRKRWCNLFHLNMKAPNLLLLPTNLWGGTCPNSYLRSLGHQALGAGTGLPLD